jgi:hypothetical protein
MVENRKCQPAVVNSASASRALSVAHGMRHPAGLQFDQYRSALTAEAVRVASSRPTVRFPRSLVLISSDFVCG